MSKKVIMIMLAVLLIMPAAAFGANVLGFRIGPAMMYNTTLDNEAFEDYEFPEDFSFGVDARLNFTVLEGNVLSFITMPGEAVDGDDYWTFDTYVNAGLSFPVARVLKLGAFIGPNFTFYAGDQKPENDIGDFMDMGVNFKGSADIMLGGLGLSAFSIIDTGVKFDNLGDSSEDLFDDANIRFGVSALFSVF